MNNIQSYERSMNNIIKVKSQLSNMNSIKQLSNSIMNKLDDDNAQINSRKT